MLYSKKRRRVYANKKIDHLSVFEWHDWTCAICGGKIDRNLRLPHQMAATIEHIVPISRGGKHEFENVAPAHAKCNFSKADFLMEEYHGAGCQDGNQLDNARRGSR